MEKGLRSGKVTWFVLKGRWKTPKALWVRLQHMLEKELWMGMITHPLVGHPIRGAAGRMAIC